MTHHLPDTTTRSSESGIALVIAMFMTLVLSVIASSLMFVSKTETVSSFSYKTMSQARYAAESGLHNAANFLLEPTYVAPLGPGAGANSIDDYVITGERVTTLDGADVVLSSTIGESNYPVQAVIDDFIAAFQNNNLAMNPGVATFSARATLVSMRQIDDAINVGNKITLQTWEITGRGRAGGLTAAEVEVSAVIERQESPVFKYAAFANDPGCGALRFAGGAGVDSYDSTANPGVKPVPDDYGGNVGTNGNMEGQGADTVIKGSLSTPRSGVGNCTAGNLTALSTSPPNGGATVTGGILKLGQAEVNPDPPEINPLPPTGNLKLNGGCSTISSAFCATSANPVPGGKDIVTIDPTKSPTPGTVTLADLQVEAGTTLNLKGGTYVVNSLSVAGNAQIKVDAGQEVIFRVAGIGVNTPIDLAGNGVVNNSYDPSNLQFIYGGDKTIKVTGGTSSAALVYAPKATVSLSGGIDFYGAIVANKISEFGGATIHYDRNLQNIMLKAGNPMMGSFTWRTF